MGTLNPVVNLHVLCRSIATGVYSTHFRTPTSERESKDCHFPCGVPSVKTNITPWKLTYKWQVSIAMLVITRGYIP